MAPTALFKKIIKALSSLKLAVLVILALCCVIAAGTFVESRFDAQAASKYVYRTWWLLSILLLLVINLTAVMIDRWPWQKKHTSFIMAHIGIILLLLGAFITVQWGLDGSLRVEIGGQNRFVASNATELSLYSSFDGANYTLLQKTSRDFFLHRPSDEALSWPTDAGNIEFKEYVPYAVAEQQVRETENQSAGAGIRVQLSNSRMNFLNWFVQRQASTETFKDLGPAQIHLVPLKSLPVKSKGFNELYFAADGEKQVKYVLLYKDANRKALRGVLKEGQSLKTGWMDIELKLLRYFPHASEETTFVANPGPTELTNQALKFEFQGKTHWVQVDDVVKLFTKEAAYVLTYGHQKIDLGFPVTLKKFTMGKYPGTSMAASYSSIVNVPDFGEHEISMNEPLHYRGLTIYQASFQNDEKGEPVASIFSVNYDPGRWLKYLGSLILTLGTVLLFYTKRKASRRLGPQNLEVP